MNTESIHDFYGLLTYEVISLANHWWIRYRMGGHASCNDCRSCVEPASPNQDQSAGSASFFVKAAVRGSKMPRIDRSVLMREQNDSSSRLALVRISRIQTYERSWIHRWISQVLSAGPRRSSTGPSSQRRSPACGHSSKD